MFRIVSSFGLMAVLCSCLNPNPTQIEKAIVDLDSTDNYFQAVEIQEKPKGYQTVESIVQYYGPQALKRLKAALEKHHLNLENLHLAILAFKDVAQVELYGRNGPDEDWIRFKTYPFTASSGGIGPKLKQGDRQIPEGVYHIESLNPNSKFHLSLRVSYPNEFDRTQAKKDKRNNLGGDIMIHGRDVTIGCIPIGDQAIEELFVLAAKSLKNSIPVIIAPQDFRKDSSYPYVLEIDWEKELYDSVVKVLKEFPI